MKVIHWFEHIRPGGGPSGYGYNLYTQLSKSNISVKEMFFVLFSSDSNSRDKAKEGTINFFKSTFPRLYFLATVLRLLIPKYRRKSVLTLRHLISDPSVIVCHDIYNASSLCKLRTQNVKVYAMIHSPKPPHEELLDELGLSNSNIMKKIASYVEIRIFSRIDGLISPSQFSYDAYYCGYFRELFEKIDKIIIPSGVNALEHNCSVTNRVNLKKCDITVGFLGRYNYDKGFDQFLLLAEKNPKIKFISAGAGSISPKEFVNYSDLGWINDPVKDFFNKIDILLVPNRIAYFDLVILEAMSIGFPVITTAVGGSKDLKHPGVTLISNNIDNDDFISSVNKIVNEYDPISIKRQYEEMYQMSCVIDRYLRVWEIK